MKSDIVVYASTTRTFQKAKKTLVPLSLLLLAEQNINGTRVILAMESQSHKVMAPREPSYFYRI